MAEILLSSIFCSSPLQLLLIFGSRIRGIFRCGVLAVQGGSPTIGLEELGSRFIAANLHYP
jgi:hypothetical protein